MFMPTNLEEGIKNALTGNVEPLVTKTMCLRWSIQKINGHSVWWEYICKVFFVKIQDGGEGNMRELTVSLVSGVITTFEDRIPMLEECVG